MQVQVFGAILAQEGLDVVVLVPVEGGDALASRLRVTTHDPGECPETLPGPRPRRRAVLPREEEAQVGAEVCEAGEGGELEEVGEKEVEPEK